MTAGQRIPELGQITGEQAVVPLGLALIADDTDAMFGKHDIAGLQQLLRRLMNQAACSELSQPTLLVMHGSAAQGMQAAQCRIPAVVRSPSQSQTLMRSASDLGYYGNL